MQFQRTFSRTPHAPHKNVEEQLFIFSRAIQQSPNAILIARVDGIVEYVNPSFTRLTGYAAEEVMGENPSISTYPANEVEKYKNLWGRLQAGKEWRGEVQGLKKNGGTYWALESISPIVNPEGEITHFLIIRQDITQQKYDQEALRESEARFRQVAEMTGEWLWEQDSQGRYTFCSSAVRDILGYRPEEVIGLTYLDLLMPEDGARWAEEFSSLGETGKGFCRLLNRYRHKDGHEVFTESTGEPIMDAKGNVVKWRGVDHNITSRKQYEDALRLRNRAIEAANVGINITDALHEHNLNIYVNPALCRITGYSREELLGRNMRLLGGPDTDPNAIAEIRQALQEGRGCELVLKNYRKDGAPFWNELLIAPVYDERGRLTHYIGIQSDVTERRQAEEERHELEIARQIQLSLLPKAPLCREGIQVAAVCSPASHVGGDYFDFFDGQEQLDVVIADVSGHSVGAALIMAEARSTLRAVTCNTQPGLFKQGPGETLRVVNELLYEDLDGADLFITMFYLSYSPNTRLLRYANAGHNCALLLRANSLKSEPLDAEGLVLGVRKQVSFEEKNLLICPGDRILLYTDGITEAQNETGEFFGIARLCQIFTDSRQEPPPIVVDRLKAELGWFCGVRQPDDDVTLVVLAAT